jgi:nanoRNase/pAp phosphatase (c-di-AMP/oligoRNAs hydrolase)
VILLGGHPDPDAIASALAHRRICERIGVSATIAHVLPISRSENRALVKLLNVPMIKVSDAAELTEFGYISLVDASACETSIKLPPGLKLLTIVDHHRPASIPKAPFVDIRPTWCHVHHLRHIPSMGSRR